MPCARSHERSPLWSASRHSLIAQASDGLDNVIGLAYSEEHFRETFCADVPTGLAQVMCANAIPPRARQFMAKRMGAATEEIDGSHTSFIAQPVRAAQFIKTALTQS